MLLNLCVCIHMHTCLHGCVLAHVCVKARSRLIPIAFSTFFVFNHISVVVVVAAAARQGFSV